MAKKKKVQEEWSHKDIYKGVLSKIEEKYGEQARNPYEDIHSTRLSTGSLVLDLTVGGGIPSGKWITVYGPESSGKSTVLYHLIKSALDADIPNILMFDYENSLETRFFENIVKQPTSELFGELDEDGGMNKNARIRYLTPQTGEIFFRILSALLDKLPDVVTKGDDRYLRFTKEQAEAADIPEKFIAFKSPKHRYVKDVGHPIKILALIDSYPEMTPAAFLADPSKSPMALQARMFSNGIPLLRPRMLAKGLIVVGLNHIRLNPNTMFGSPEYDPCGVHLKMASDIRVRIGSVAIPHGKGRIEEEKSLFGNSERFGYSKIKTYKNKTFPKDKEGIIRICFESDGLSGYGIDPVWDTFEYLKLTQQITKRGDKVKLTLPGPWENIALTWDDLRWLVYNPVRKEVLTKLMSSEAVKKIIATKVKPKTKVKRLNNLLDLRKACFNQILTKAAFKLTVK